MIGPWGKKTTESNNEEPSLSTDMPGIVLDPAVAEMYDNRFAVYKGKDGNIHVLGEEDIPSLRKVDKFTGGKSVWVSNKDYVGPGVVLKQRVTINNRLMNEEKAFVICDTGTYDVKIPIDISVKTDSGVVSEVATNVIVVEGENITEI